MDARSVGVFVLSLYSETMFWIAVAVYAAWRTAQTVSEQPAFDPKRGLKQERPGMVMGWAGALVAPVGLAAVLSPLPIPGMVAWWLLGMSLMWLVFAGFVLAGFRVPQRLVVATFVAMAVVDVGLGAAMAVAFESQVPLSMGELLVLGATLSYPGVSSVTAFLCGWMTQRVWEQHHASVLDGQVEPLRTIEQAHPAERREVD
jgi:hypothetical protein